MLLDVGENPSDNEPDVVSSVVPGVEVPCPFSPLVVLGVFSRDFDTEDSDCLVEEAIVDPEVLDDQGNNGLEEPDDSEPDSLWPVVLIEVSADYEVWTLEGLHLKW